MLRSSMGGDENDDNDPSPLPPPPPPPRPPLQQRMGDSLARRLEKVSPLEIRLDLSILWCHVLGRGLFSEILTRPLKTRPGIELEDLQILLGLVSSASLLSVLWATVGTLATDQFQAYKDQDEYWTSQRRLGSGGGGRGGGGDGSSGGGDDGGALRRYLQPTVATWAVAGPLWLAGDEASRLKMASLALSSGGGLGGGGGVGGAVVGVDDAAVDALATALLSQPLARSALENAATDCSALLGLLVTVCGARLLALWLPS